MDRLRGEDSSSAHFGGAPARVVLATLTKSGGRPPRPRRGWATSIRPRSNLPVREGEDVFVWLAMFADEDDHARSRFVLERATG